MDKPVLYCGTCVLLPLSRAQTPRRKVWPVGTLWRRRMPVIVAANTKGGSGKSTSSLILGT
ncbi:MAG: hypothetical protein ACRYHB_03485, partial [Janthinobacterium lividum]